MRKYTWVAIFLLIALVISVGVFRLLSSPNNPGESQSAPSPTYGVVDDQPRVFLPGIFSDKVSPGYPIPLTEQYQGGGVRIIFGATILVIIVVSGVLLDRQRRSSDPGSLQSPGTYINH